MSFQKNSLVTVISIILVVSSFYPKNSLETSLPPQRSPCPASSEKTHQTIENYLKKEAVNEDLTSNYGIDIDQSSHENVVALDNEEYAEECEALIQTFDFLREDEKYSYAIYKVAGHYFLLQYQISEEDEFSWNSISINTSEFEFIAAVINW